MTFFAGMATGAAGLPTSNSLRLALYADKPEIGQIAQSAQIRADGANVHVNLTAPFEVMKRLLLPAKACASQAFAIH